jgi:hypothetical protein
LDHRPRPSERKQLLWPIGSALGPKSSAGTAGHDYGVKHKWRSKKCRMRNIEAVRKSDAELHFVIVYFCKIGARRHAQYGWNLGG